MTTPDVPHRIEFSVEVPGTPEQVWHALATSAGISSWFLPTDVDERVGGAIVVHMGETDAPGTVTGWDPPRRFAYEEPEWAALSGQPDAPVTPLASEFLVEARSGGTCVVRVVSSAFGTGADWENEAIDDMERSWRPYFEQHLRLYLSRFAGEDAATVEVAVELPGTVDAVNDAIARAAGAAEAGGSAEPLGLTGRVETLADPYLVVSLTEPVPGYVSLFAIPAGGDRSSVMAAGWFFGEEAQAFVDEAPAVWRSWLEGLAVSDPSSPAQAR